MTMANLRYDSALAVGLQRAGFLKVVIVACWFALPVLAVTIMHPSDAAGFWYWFNGQEVPQYFSSQQIVRGELTAWLALGATLFVYLVAVTLFYRKAQFFVALWPLAGLLVGVVGNAGWWFGTGMWDQAGMLAGWMPAALAGTATALCEKLGADFVFGKDNRPGLDTVEDY
jgi:hypothetical protein